MHNVIKTLTQVANRYAPSRMLSFEEAHVFRALQLMGKHGRISRLLLTEELNLGEGSIKTMVKHLKMQGLVETSKAGMWMTDKGLRLYSKLNESIPSEMDIPQCSIGLGKYNHVVLIKGLESEIGSGVEQRDTAIKMGATGATTLLYREEKFYMPNRNQDSLRSDFKIRKSIIETLRPEESDVIIIGSAEKKKIAEIATKQTALITIANHHKHV
jgi:predicted transcriptional regulator